MGIQLTSPDRLEEVDPAKVRIFNLLVSLNVLTRRRLIALRLCHYQRYRRTILTTIDPLESIELRAWIFET